jgi:hypothetical protein
MPLPPPGSVNLPPSGFIPSPGSMPLPPPGSVNLPLSGFIPSPGSMPLPPPGALSNSVPTNVVYPSGVVSPVFYPSGYPYYQVYPPVTYITYPQWNVGSCHKHCH